MMPRNFMPPPPQLIVWRKRLFFFITMSLFAVLVVAGPLRIAHFIQPAKKEAALRHAYQKTLFAHRGDIVDALGVPLAMSTDVYEVRADMVELASTADNRQRLQKLIPPLASILKKSEDFLSNKLDGVGRAVLLSKKLPPAAAWQLYEFRRQHGLYGLRIDYKSKRYYPQGEFAASVVGYINHKNHGQTGIEFVRQKDLQQKDGEKSGVRARNGWRIDGGLSRPPRNGKNITLSIDSRLQFYAYEALQKAVRYHQAAAAAAAIMDVQTGHIIALASYPEVNPNNIDAGHVIKNRAFSDQMEPGSLAKPFIVALALDTGVTRPDEVFPAHQPQHIGGVLVKPGYIRQPLNLTGVLQKSSNVGVAMLAWRIGKKPIWALYQQLGFGGGKVLNMPGEASGLLRKHSSWRDSELVTHSYGYNFSTTLLQMLAGYSVFATDGWRISPRLEKTAQPPFRQRILSPAIARQVRRMMESVTQEGGTAPAAAIDGYRIAGKTGTAKKAKVGGYYDDVYRAFFVGIAPASRPRYVAAVMIDNPRQHGTSGGAAAAPVFQEIVRQALRLNAVAPDSSSRADDV